jgi:hypothetical protein
MTEFPQIIDVVEAKILARHIVELAFEDGERRVIDLEPFLVGPMFEPLTSDYALFCKLRVDPAAGTIVWPNGADISPRTLYAESKRVVPA